MAVHKRAMLAGVGVVISGSRAGGVREAGMAVHKRAMLAGLALIMSGQASAVMGEPAQTAQVKANPLKAEMQQLEWARGAAIKAGDMAALGRIYASDFSGITARGVT